VAAALTFRERVVFEAGIRETLRFRDRLVHGLGAISGVEVFPSEANYVLFRVQHASAVWRDLLHDHSVLVRDFSRTPGLEDCLRVTVGSEAEVERFLAAMEEIMASKRAASHFGMSASPTGRIGKVGK
jgi:histidinol-phosphate aminotransferase